MQIIRFLAVLLMLLSASSTGSAYSFTEIQIPTDQGITSQLSEDQVDLSFSNLVTSADVCKNRIPFSSPAILIEENSGKISSNKAYYSGSRFLEPGLSLADIIFPFHTFL